MMDVRKKLVELFYDNNVRCDQKIEGLADDVMDIIANGVTVQEWMHEETESGFPTWKCSRCGHGTNYDPNGIDLYCYHCGAKMDGGSDNA